MGKVERALYKALKRCVDAFDKNVALRALVTAVPNRLYHRGIGRVVEIESSGLANSVIERVVRNVNKGADFYRPGAVARLLMLASAAARPLLLQLRLNSYLRACDVFRVVCPHQARSVALGSLLTRFATFSASRPRLLTRSRSIAAVRAMWPAARSTRASKRCAG